MKNNQILAYMLPKFLQFNYIQMETINDVLNFLNQMEIYNILTVVELSTFNIIRKI